MNPASAEMSSPKWTTTRWVVLIALVFVAHVALIFLFGAKNQIVARAAKNVPQLQLADDSSELLALNDPTLFALPHAKDFAFAASLKILEIKQPSFHWTEAPRWLPSSLKTFGATFQQFMRTNQFAAYPLDFKPRPKLNEPFFPVETAFAQNSTLQVQGDLVRRKLLNEINLPSLPFNDVIAPSKVQVLVDAAGNVISVVPLESSGWNDADIRALDFARRLRFAPATQLTLGQLIFNWRTVPLSATNTPANPQ
jgi:TonB family protein